MGFYGRAMGQVGNTKEFECAKGSTFADTSGLRVLAVGNMVGRDPNLQTVPGAHFVDFEGLTEDVIAGVEPDVVLSPLVTAQFDCVELGYRLVAAGFSGRYRVFADSLPRPDLVKREMKLSFPGLDFDLVVVGQHAQAHTL